MSLWKKTKDLFKRLAGSTDSPPSKAPAVPAELPVFFEPLPQYQQEQRDFEARANATALLWNSAPKTLGGQGTMVLGRNAAKRSLRAAIEPKYGRRWKKQHVARLAVA